MKRSLIYIGIFLIICGGLWWFSGVVDNVLMNWYMIDITSELNEVFEDNDILYMDGSMLSIYLYDSMERFKINGNMYDYFEGDYQYNALNQKSYRIEKVEGEQYLIINEDYSHPIIKLSSIIKLDKVIMFRKIITNIITIVLGLGLWVSYARKYNPIKKAKSDKFTQIPV